MPAGVPVKMHVAGQQRQHGGELGDQAGHAEDEIAGACVLHRLAVDRTAQREVVGVGDSSGVTTHGPIGP